MVVVAGLMGILGFLAAFAPAWFAWKKTAGRPVLRTISVTVTAVIGLLIFTIIREVTTEFATRYARVPFFSALTLQMAGIAAPLTVGFLIGALIGKLSIKSYHRINWIILSIFLVVTTAVSVLLFSPVGEREPLMFIGIGIVVSAVVTIATSMPPKTPAETLPTETITAPLENSDKSQDDLIASVPSSLKLMTVQPEGSTPPSSEVAQEASVEEAPLTIVEAKRRLAATHGVDISAIKITIEG